MTAESCHRPPAAEVAPIRDGEFRLFQRLIYDHAGIFLGPAKKELLAARLRRRLRARDTRSFLAYYRLVQHEPGERTRMLDCISTNETRFFREPRQFEYLQQRVFPDLRATARLRPRRLRVWSAGCSTGEEPYSLAMSLLEGLPGWKIEILATDLSTRALARARSALWPIDKAEDIPPHYLKRFMLRGTRRQAGQMKAGPEIRSLIRFQHFNLNARHYPSLGHFDLIFCRNVLIYFNVESRARTLERLLEHLVPNGALFLGHAESLSGLTPQVRGVGPNIYTHAATTARRAPAAGRGGWLHAHRGESVA